MTTMKMLWLVIALAACSKETPPAAPTAVPAAAPAARGRVVTEHFASEALGVDKDVVVYLPAGYDAAPDRRWPVFYYLHGLGSDEHNWVKGGKLDERADALGLAAIVVMPDGDDSFYTNSATPAPDYEACLADGTGLLDPRQPKRKTCVKHRAYETYIVRDLVAWVDRTYRTHGSRDGRAIAGLSMGGFGALQLAMRHPDVFAAAASHSGIDSLLYLGPWPYVKGKVELATDVTHWGEKLGPMGAWLRGIFGPDLAAWQALDPVTLSDKLAPGSLALYLDCGSDDELALYNGMQHLHDRLLERGYAHEYFLGPGGHNHGFWSPRLPSSLAFLRAHTKPPSP